MPQVNVTISGKAYRMACGEGEEEHLSSIAATFDARIGEMRDAFGEIGDMRLHVMAALTAFDELAELKKRNASLESETMTLRKAATSGDGRLAAEIDRTAERIDRLARSLAGNSSA